jgi:hypothetical protein
MFWHQSIIISTWIVFLCFSRLPQDDTLVPKHVGVGTNDELHFVICIVLYFIESIC